MTEEQDENAKLLRQLVFERESPQCRGWWKTPQVSGQPASSFNGTFRSGQESRGPREDLKSLHPKGD